MTPPGFDNAFLRELPGDPEPRNFVRQVRNAAWSQLDPTPARRGRVVRHRGRVVRVVRVVPVACCVVCRIVTS